MAKEKSTIRNEKEENEISIVEGWASTCKEYRFGGLNEQEKAQFEKAQFAEDQAKKTRFVLGEPLHHTF
jgi:hypothetical protein